MNPLRTAFAAALVVMALGHSLMTEPQSTSPWTCRVGGEPKFGVQHCPGPCDLRGVEAGRTLFDSPSKPARVYKRGQEVVVKYARNNHAPGGFMRLSLVEPSKMMSKKAHEKNAFYYSCWGANSVRAPPHELKELESGYSLVGADAKQHDLPPGYYTTRVRIPKVIPDGDYVLGWVWFGGTAGGRIENSGHAKFEPTPHGYFSDYWSCSYVRIKGGASLESRHVPIFDNDMAQFSSQGCMSANDFPGVCSYEPCRVPGKYQKPRPFANGRTPRPLTPQDFGGTSGRVQQRSGPPKAPPATSARRRTANSNNLSLQMRIRRRCCKCLGQNGGCWVELARRTKNYCKGRTQAHKQPAVCKEACCVFCKSKPSARSCRSSHVKRVCML